MGVGGRCRRYCANEEVGPDDMTNEGLVGLGVRRRHCQVTAPPGGLTCVPRGGKKNVALEEGGNWEDSFITSRRERKANLQNRSAVKS